jgi:hypothetical protein
MVVRKRLIALDDLCQISLHQLIEHIDLLEFLPADWLEDGLDSNDIVVLQQPHDLELSQCPLSKYLVLKRLLYFLNGNQIILLVLRLQILCCHHNPVCS